jgi:ADP-ribose pyrophosphatase YjhB (NUDIX family)
MPEAHEELLNYYDPQGRVLGTAPRAQAKASGRAVGAVNVLIRGPESRVLLQRRPIDVENGGLWDKSVGGHVSAGEDFDETVVRETGEELFGGAGSAHVRLISESADPALDVSELVALQRVTLQKNLRDVRRGPARDELRNVIYHVAIYLGRTGLALERFTPQRSEIDELAYFAPAEIDRLLVRGELAPNMGFLWLTQAHALLAL